MSSCSTPRYKTLKSAAAQEAYTFVKPGADRAHVAQATAATDKITGIAQTKADGAEESIEVAGPGGGAKLRLGGTVTAGDLLTSDASGRGIATTTANNRAGAVADEDGVEGDIIGVEVQISNI